MSRNKLIENALEKQHRFYPCQYYNKTAILELLDYIDKEYETILDVGCGDGGLLELINNRFYKSVSYGITISEEEVISCQNKNVNVKITDGVNIPFNNNSFELVISRHMLEHSPVPELILEEINRVLVQDGTVIICVPSYESEFSRNWEDHFSVLKKEKWIDLFQKAGFEVLKSDDGTWLASASMENESEYRFVLKKIKSNTKIINEYEPVIIYQNKIALIIHNLVLFEQIEKVLLKSQYDLDIYIYYCFDDYDQDWQKMSEDTYEFLINKGYNPKFLKNKNNIKYKIVLSALPYGVNLLGDFYIRYNYGLAKEDTNFADWNILFDFILCYGKHDSSFLKVYSSPIEVGAVKFLNFKKGESKKKKRILYLPTYGPMCSIEYIHEELFKLKDEYDIFIKAHHGTTFLEPNRMELLTKFGKLCDHKDSLSELLANADLVISDGSGAIFDAIHNDIPVLIYNKNPNNLSNSLEYKIIKEDQVPVFSSATDLKKHVENALKSKQYEKKRRMLKDYLFSVSPEVGADKIIELFKKIFNDEFTIEERNYLKQRKSLSFKFNIYDKVSTQYKVHHKEQQIELLSVIQNGYINIKELNDEIFKLSNQVNELKNKNDEIKNTNDELKISNYELKNTLNEVYNSKSWKITKPFRKLIDKIRG